MFPWVCNICVCEHMPLFFGRIDAYTRNSVEPPMVAPRSVLCNNTTCLHFTVIQRKVLAHAYVSAMDDALRVAIAHVSSQQGGMFKTGPEAALSSARALRSQVEIEL